ncbi:MAG: GerMN domain-containing protein [Actinomycetes bacterium]
MTGSTWSRVARAVAAFSTAFVLASCGVPQDGATRALDAGDVPYRLLDEAAGHSADPSVSGPLVTVPQVFFLDGDERLVPQPQPMAASGLEPVVGALLGRLATGPTEQQRGRGLGSALGPGARLRLLQVTDGLASVEVTPSQQSPAADRLPLAIGQVVLTAASVDGVDRVLLVRDGQPLEAPLPGGERTSEPLTPSDYTDLLAVSATRTQKAEPGP